MKMRAGLKRGIAPYPKNSTTESEKAKMPLLVQKQGLVQSSSLIMVKHVFNLLLIGQ